jgi:hypothetical protein
MPLARIDLNRIVHIPGVDHPESISVGPRGEAYTTGTAGQVYRLNLETNTVEQFASTAPRRVLGTLSMLSATCIARTVTGER